VSLLKVRNLEISFPAPDGELRAVAGLSFSVHHGETLCLVGESGSGKSLTALAVMGLLPRSAQMRGEILFENERVMTGESPSIFQGHRFCGRGMAMIFQEPTACLNPSMTVLQLVGEAWSVRRHGSRGEVRDHVKEALAQAGVPEPDELLARYPWQLSGGLAQRVMIASALILQPRLLIADEPTTALDVTTQVRILSLLCRLRTERNLALLFITHDLSVAGLMGGRTMVLRHGEAVETGETREVLASPQHPFTRSLVDSSPASALRAGRSRMGV